MVVKKSILFILFAVTVSSMTVGCNLTAEAKDRHPETRLAKDDEKLIDFSKGWSKDFMLANGYRNGDPFGCYWSKDAASVKDGKLELSLYEKDGNFYGAEYRSYKNAFHYGFYAIRMKAADCPGVISSFFTYTNRPAWDEIDIEFLGKNMRQVQFNYYTQGVGGHEKLVDLGFDASKEFHEYGFHWIEGSIAWYVDGKRVHIAAESIPSNSQQIMMNLWNCRGHDSWSGKFDPSKLPVKSEYEFIAYSPEA